MDFQTKKTGTYFKIYKGKFAIQMKQPTAETVTRENKNGKVVHELLFDRYAGFIKEISYLDKDNDGNPLKYGPQLNIRFQSETGSEATLAVLMKSIFARRFLLSFPNFDLNKVLIMNIEPSSFESNGEMIETISVYFGQVLTPGEKPEVIKQAFKKDNWGDITPPEKIPDGKDRDWETKRVLYS